MDQNKNSFLDVERELFARIMRLVPADFKWLRQTFLKGIRFAWRHQPGPIESSSKEAASYPIGPYAASRKQQMGDILLWVPRRIDSFIINNLQTKK